MSEPIVSKLEEIIERLPAWLYYAFTVALLCFGFVFDLAGYQGFWGMRSGGVVAGLIAFCFFKDLRQHEAWWKWLRDDHAMTVADLEQPLREAQAEGKLMAAMGSTPHQIQQHTGQVFNITRPAVQGQRQVFWQKWTKARKALSAQGTCIGIGTFVWAFGDLPVAMFRCGNVVC